jgi:hypothetical protein
MSHGEAMSGLPASRRICDGCLQAKWGFTLNDKIRRMMTRIGLQPPFLQRCEQIQLPKRGLESGLKLLYELSITIFEAFGPLRQGCAFRAIDFLSDLVNRFRTRL